MKTIKIIISKETAIGSILSDVFTYTGLILVAYVNWRFFKNETILCFMSVASFLCLIVRGGAKPMNLDDAIEMLEEERKIRGKS